ncbi:MAG: DUF5343 domain-containing protein [Candidatus Acidiferrales bacterium]|jgi:hypothetical protein
MADSLPYVNGYGGIPKLFAAIKSASVPPKFTQDYLSTVLDLRSSSYRAMIPLLKKLGFIDQANVPTQAYRDYRDDVQSGAVMAQKMREAYAPVFAANEYAWKLDKKNLESKIKTVTGLGDDDTNLYAIVGTFAELSKLAKWEGAAPPPKREEGVVSPPDGRLPEPGDGGSKGAPFGGGRMGLSYTINLNLPATTEIEVFNAIFRSLRENLLREQ